MSKRKVAGGYDESSDGPEVGVILITEPATKKPKPVPYAPPRLSVAPKPNISAFQFPLAQTHTTRTSVPPGAPLVSTLHLRPESEGAQPGLDLPDLAEKQATLQESFFDSESEDVAPLSPSINIRVNVKTAGHLPRLGTGPPAIPTKSTSTRSTLSLERQFNELANWFDKYKDLSDERHQQTDEKLTRLLEAVSRLPPAENAGVAPAPAPGRSVSMSSTLSDTKPYLSNPLPTPELTTLISKVVSEAWNRVSRKRGGTEDNSVKEHTRITFYRMLGITAAKSILPYFEDEHGEPDTLPSQFVDPKTNYCQPYPHWKVPLTNQVLWIPMFLLWFRSTIPNDQSERSALLRSLTDEQIVALLHDGPFRSAQTMWRNMKKTDEELEAMRASARKYRRTERKAATRAKHIQLIPSLQGPEWEYLSHPGYMSEDESDDDGEIVTKRPDHWAQWETNLYEAICVARLEKAKAWPGPCPSPPQHKVEMVKCLIPHLEHGTGSSKLTIRIPWCGLSKTWHEQHSEDFKKYAHLINMKVTTKPDITAFLAKHLMPTDNNDADGWDQGDNTRARTGGSMDLDLGGMRRMDEPDQAGKVGWDCKEDEEGNRDDGVRSTKESTPALGLCYGY